MDTIKEKLKNIKLQDIVIISDFDHTLTAPVSLSSSDVVSKNKAFPIEYRQKHDEIDEYYRKIEKDLTIPKSVKAKAMKDWNDKVISLMIEYDITKEEISEAINNKNSMILREGAKEIIKFSHQKNIPFIIISAGIKNSIEAFLKNQNLLFDNVYIISNEILFDGNKIKQNQNFPMTSQNKDQVIYPENVKSIVQAKKLVLLFGDNITDALMAPKNKTVIKFAFPYTQAKEVIEKFNETFDFIEDGKPLYKEVLEILKEKNE